MENAYRIPERNLDGLQKQLEKLNRRATRLDVTPVTMRETGEEFELWATPRCEDAGPFRINLRPRETLAQAEDRARVTFRGRWLTFLPRRYVLVVVAGEAPKINGWSFAAVLQHLEGGNILAYVPGWETAVPTSYREAEPYCDHCRTTRERKDTYLVCSDAGEWKQIGRSCLRDFTGHKDPQAIAEFAEHLAMFSGSCSAAEEYDDFGGGSQSRWISMASFLGVVAWCVRTEGWVSRKAAKDAMGGLQATADLAMHILWPARNAEDEKLGKGHAETHTDDDDRVAREAIEWAQSLEPKVDDDYLWNLRVLAHSDAIEIRQTGLAASMVAAHARATERELERRRQAEGAKNSEWVGQPKERIETDLTLVSTKFFDNDFGGTNLMMFTDPAGNRIKWWASASAGWEPAIGSTSHVKATVKEHAEYKGIKETVVSRVQEYDPAAAAAAKAAAKEAARARAKAKRQQVEWLCQGCRNFRNTAAVTPACCPLCGSRQFAPAEPASRPTRTARQATAECPCCTATVKYTPSADSEITCGDCGTMFGVEVAA